MNGFPLYWIGIRESELEDTGVLFTGSITIFGTGTGSNYAFDKEYNYRYDYNQDSEQWNSFINEKAQLLLSMDPNTKFMLYYPVDISILLPDVAKNTLYANDIHMTKFLDDKIRTRMWLSEHISMPPFTVDEGENIRYSYLKSIFPGYEKFVIQCDYSCGGTGTWLLTYDNATEITKRLSPHIQYMAMPYLEHSVSLNIHLVIYAQDILMMPASIQLISLKSYSLAYQGSDFITYTHLPQYIQDRVQKAARIIGKQLQYSGYRGVCGVDFIATSDEVFFSEINGRFQSSTILINKALRNIGLNTSLQALHIDACENPKCTIKLSDFKVNYSFYGYSYQPYNIEKIKSLLQYAKNTPEIIEIQTDALDWNMVLESNTYLFKLIADTGISALGTDFTTILQCNLDIMDHIFNPSNYNSQMLELKIMLLSHGIRVDQKALVLLNQKGGINYEEFEALDMVIKNDIYINVPYKTKFSSLSPFCISINSKEEFILTYFEAPITTVAIRTKDPLSISVSGNGILYSNFIYLGNDRLRIFYRNGCHFKSLHKGCKFCDIEMSQLPLPIEDIKEAINAYADNENIRHFLIGGGSEPIDSDFKKVIQIVEYLNEKFHKPINVMSIPPLDIGILSRLKNAGVTEVTFNLEVFDRHLAKQYMPGKGAIPLEIYDTAFREAVRLWGNTGNVRTVFIVGLESEESLLCGIEHVCQLGVHPILSLLKGIQGTPMEHFLPPSDKQILEICRKVQAICQSFGVDLGPTCHCCEDNTLKISNHQR